MPLLRAIHRWCGIILAAFIIVISLSGAVSAFRGDLVRVALPAARGPAASPESFGPALDAFTAAHPDTLVSVKLAPYDLAVHAAFIDGGTRAWIGAQGQLVDRWRGTRGLGEWALQLHHKLLIGNTGETVTGIVGVAGLGMVVTGLIIYWPARRGFSWRLWPASGKRLALLKSHRNIALLLAIPLLLQFGSGAAMVFDRPLAAFLGVANPKPPVVAPGTAPMRWTAIIAQARAAVPGAAVRAIGAPKSPDKPYQLRLQQAGDINPEGATRVLVAGGAVVQVNDPAKQGITARVMGSLLGLHTAGYIGGVPAQLLLALLGVLLASVAMLGVLGWLRVPKRGAATR